VTLKVISQRCLGDESDGLGGAQVFADKAPETVRLLRGNCALSVAHPNIAAKGGLFVGGGAVGTDLITQKS
jgi:hypothetical protein